MPINSDVGYFLWLLPLALLLSSDLRATEDPCATSATRTAAAPDEQILKIEQLATTLAEDLRPKHRAYLGPEELREQDTRTLAKLLVTRLREGCEAPKETGASSKDLQADVIMMVPHANFEGIARFGFLNQHKTQASIGASDRKGRFLAEQDFSLMRLPYSDKGKELLPKYAILNLKGGDFGKFSLPAHYGDVAVVFKPEVKQRMIWSYTDSLGTDKSRRRLRRPPMTAQYETPEANRKACYGYCEAQIWGALDLTDVAYLMIKEGDKVPESLKKLGVPVYFYRPEPNPEHAAGFTRLEQAVAGNPARIKRPDVLTLSEIEKAKNEPAVRDIPKPFPNPIKSILVSKEQSILSESELLERISSPESTPADRESDSAFDPKEQLVAELATRPKTPAVIRKLKELMTDSSVHIRSQAAYGLSELPWSEFKRIALHCLKDSSEVVKLECLALVADHLTDDADIAKAIRELEAAEGDSKLKDWIKVLQAKRLCDSMASER